MRQQPPAVEVVEVVATPADPTALPALLALIFGPETATTPGVPLPGVGARSDAA